MPDNLGAATTDHGMVKGYKNGFLYNGNYYTPKYGDAVVEYRFNEWNESAGVTINGTGNNLVGVNITEEVGNIKSVTYNRPFSSGKAATVILPSTIPVTATRAASSMASRKWCTTRTCTSGSARCRSQAIRL